MYGKQLLDNVVLYLFENCISLFNILLNFRGRKLNNKTILIFYCGIGDYVLQILLFKQSTLNKFIYNFFNKNFHLSMLLPKKIYRNEKTLTHTHRTPPT